MISPNVDAQDLGNLKKWQIKGAARSAQRIGDNYAVRDYYGEIVRRDSSNISAMVKYAEYLLKTRDYELALKKLQWIQDGYPDKYPLALYHLAQVQKIRGEHQLALDNFNLLRRRFKRFKLHGITKNMLMNEIAGCNLALAPKDSVTKIVIDHLGSSINKPHIEFGPIILSDTCFVYGSSNITEVKKVSIDTDQQPSRQFYMATKHSGEWQGEQSPVAPFIVENQYDTGRGVFSLNGQRFYFTQCFTTESHKNICHLFVTEKTKEGWSKPVELNKNINHPKYTSTQPTIGTCYDKQLEVIYFVSDRPGGAGGLDIWYTVYDTRFKKYHPVSNAGVYINTPLDEITPFYDLPSHQLYFSSNGWPTIGGFDIFRAKGDLVNWEPSENIGTVINSTYDDLNYVRNTSGQFGLMASNRPGSFYLTNQSCCDDLFTVEETETSRVLVSGKLMKSELMKENNYYKKNVINNDTSSVSLNNQQLAIQLMQDSTSSVFIYQSSTNEKGEFEFWVDPNMNYEITVLDSTIMDRNFAVSTKKMADSKTLKLSTIDFSAIPEQAIVVENIYYDFDQIDLNVKAKEAVDTTLLLLAIRFPKAIFEISSHTDDKGDQRYNQRLSDKRAANVVLYLVSKGVEPSRLKAKGYGESKPLAPNVKADGTDNPEGRQKNRRTEFRVVGIIE